MNDEKAGTIGSIILLIVQIALLVMHYGFGVNMPWWVMFLPLILWLAGVFIILFILLGAVVMATTASLADYNHPIIGILVGIFGFGVLIGLLYLLACAIAGFLAGLV